MGTLYKILSILGDFKAASKGPNAYVKRKVNQKAHKTLSKALRKMWK